MDNFEKWLCREMPAGTVIGNPSWWAPRIMKAAQAEAQQTIATELQVTCDKQSKRIAYLLDRMKLIIGEPINAEFIAEQALNEFLGA